MATTPKKKAANRKNALLSTGPKTKLGKAAIRYNALKHGILAKETLIPGESRAEFRRLAESFREWLDPVGPLEDFLQGNILKSAWRLRRLNRVETALFAEEPYSSKQTIESWDELMSMSPEQLKIKMWETEVRICGEESAKKIFILRGEEPPGESSNDSGAEEKIAKRTRPNPGLAFHNMSLRGDTFTKLARYRAAEERSFYRSLHELQRLQAARKGLKVHPPIAVNVDLSTDSAMS